MEPETDGTSSDSVDSWVATFGFLAAIALGVVLFFVPEPITSVLVGEHEPR